MQYINEEIIDMIIKKQGLLVEKRKLCIFIVT